MLGGPAGTATSSWRKTGRGKPSLVISTLDAPVVLIALKLFHGSRSSAHRTRIVVCPTWTDNRGNGAALNHLMTIKIPASAVVMELAASMKKELAHQGSGQVVPAFRHTPRQTNSLTATSAASTQLSGTKWTRRSWSGEILPQPFEERR